MHRSYPSNAERRSRRRALKILVGALATGAAAHLFLPTGLRAQERPDTLPADSAAAPTFVLEGFQISVARPSAGTGGAAAVTLAVDSADVLPTPTLENVLRNMPLIQIRRNSRGEAQPALRGAEDRQIAVLMDGVPLTMGWDARTDLSIIPLTAARNVRIVRGLSSVLLGPNVLGGAVEVDIASGHETLPPPLPFNAGFEVNHTGATRLQVSGGGRTESSSGTWDFRGGVGFQELGGWVLAGGLLDDPDLRPQYLTDDGDLRLNTDVSRLDGFLSARYQRDSGAWFSLVGSGITLDRGVAPEAHVDDPRLWRYPDQDRLVAALSGGTGFRDTPLGRGDLEMSFGVDLGRTEIQSFSAADYENVVETEFGDDRTLSFRTVGDLAVTDRSDLRAAITFGQVLHDETIDQDPTTTYEQRLWSLGAEWERRFDRLLGIPGTSGTRFTVGAAADGSDTPQSGDKPALGRLWDWGGRVGVATLAGDDFLLHANISRRTRFPALRELYSGALGRFEPNPDLKPEEMLAGELGFTVDWDRPGAAASGGNLQVVGFHQRLRDGIVRTSVTDDEGNRKFKRVNQDEVRSTGVEILASALLGPVSLSGDLTLQKVRGIDPDGGEVKLEYEPSAAGKLLVQLPIVWEVSGFADGRYLSEQYCQNPEAGGLEGFSSDPRFDLGLLRRFGLRQGGAFRSLDATIRVENVGDAAIFDQCGLPQPGRTFSLQLTLR